MHAAAQVEAEVHGQRIQAGQPLRRGRQQVERDDVLRIAGIGVECLFENVLGLQLGVGVLQAGLHAIEVELDAVVVNAGRLQGFFDAEPGLFIDLERGFGTGYLHGRRFAEEIGQGVNKAQHQCNGNGDVLPERIAIHSGFKAKKAASGRLLGVVTATSACPWAERCR